MHLARGKSWFELVYRRPEWTAPFDRNAFYANGRWWSRMDGEGDRRLFELDAVVARRVVVGYMTSMNRRHELLVRTGNGDRRRRYRCIRLDGGHLSLRGRAWVEVVRNRRPSLTKTSGIHARDHRHDIDIGGHGHEAIVVACCKSHMERRLRLHGLHVLHLLDGHGEVACLVQDVIMAAIAG